MKKPRGVIVSRSIRAKSTVQCNDTLGYVCVVFVHIILYEYSGYSHMSFVISFRVHRNLTYDRDIG